MIIQGLSIRQEICAEGRGEHAEEPGPVVYLVLIEYAREEDQEDAEWDYV